MKAHRISKNSNELTLDEKIKLLEEYDMEDLLYVLRDIESYPSEYDKEILIAVHSHLFEKGITCV